MNTAQPLYYPHKVADFLSGFICPISFGLIPYLESLIVGKPLSKVIMPLESLLEIVGAHFQLEWMIYISIAFMIFFYGRKRFIAYGAMVLFGLLILTLFLSLLFT